MSYTELQELTKISGYAYYTELRDAHLSFPCSPTLFFTYIERLEDIHSKWSNIQDTSLDEGTTNLYKTALEKWQEEIPPIISSAMASQQALLWNELQNLSPEQIEFQMLRINDIQKRWRTVSSASF